METPQVYVACLASYNQGLLYGQWIDATQTEEEMVEAIQTMLANSPIAGAEEFAFHDFSGFGRLMLEEHESIAHLVEYAEFIMIHEELGLALLEEYGLAEAETMLNEQYQGCYKSEMDFAEQLFDECYSHQVPASLKAYIDYDAFAHDLFLDDYCSIKVDGLFHVFSTV